MANIQANVHIIDLSDEPRIVDFTAPTSDGCPPFYSIYPAAGVALMVRAGIADEWARGLIEALHANGLGLPKQLTHVEPTEEALDEAGRQLAAELQVIEETT